jgi:hypothetical protein
MRDINENGNDIGRAKKAREDAADAVVYLGHDRQIQVMW